MMLSVTSPGVAIMDTMISQILSDSANLKSALSSNKEFVGRVEQSAEALFSAVKSGGTIYACGNGGSTCDAMHLCEELVARYKRNRPGIRAMHFMDPSVLTCWGNDFSLEDAFRRVAETFCTDKDVLIAISTSGNSKNVIHAVHAAKSKGSKVIGLLGRDGGALAPLVDIPLIVPASATERIQEAHITVIHIWCELLETHYGLAQS
jgi:D-sedoheptulose 7-phosphate isomerase